MSAPLDVLAVMDAEIARAGFDAFPSGRNLIRARAAVAELVEHVRDLSLGMPLSYADNARVIGNSNALVLERLRAALARIKGGAA